MLEYPSNFYPCDIAIDKNDSSQNYIGFTFNGDMMSAAYFRGDDYTTGITTGIGGVASSTGRPICYNGQWFAVNGSDLFVNGHDYTGQVLITQRSVDGTENIYDIPVLNGEVQEDYTSGATKIVIEDKIASIYQWGDNGAICTPDYQYGYCVIGMIIKINNESHFIAQYDKRNGEITLDTGFNQTITKGTRYQLYSNYIISPEYFFKCRSTPVVSVSITDQSDVLQLTGSYSQAEGSLIKWYRFHVYKTAGNTDTIEAELADSGRVYSQDIKYSCVTQCRKNDNRAAYRAYYKAVLEVMTQDNVLVTAEQRTTSQECEQVYVFDDTPSSQSTWGVYFNSYENTVYTNAQIDSSLCPNGTNSSLVIFRKDLNTGDIDIVSRTDYTVSSHGKYEYTIVPVADKGTSTHSGEVYLSRSFTIETNFLGYTITAIYPTDRIKTMHTATSVGTDLHKQIYTVGDTWKFRVDLENTTVTQNTDKKLYTGYGKYSTVAETDVDYMSGTVSGMFGYLNCATKKFIDDINTLNEWRKFITQKCQFILRSQKGDVWIINVVDNPTTEYQEDYWGVPARFSFNWAECASVSEVYIDAD